MHVTGFHKAGTLRVCQQANRPEEHVLRGRHDEDAALTFGKAVANTFSQAKGQSLGILPPERWDAQVQGFAWCRLAAA